MFYLIITSKNYILFGIYAIRGSYYEKKTEVLRVRNLNP